MPSLSSFCAVLKPFMPFSTMKAVMQLRARSLRRGAHVDEQHVGVGAVGDPHLDAVGDPAIAFAARRGRSSSRRRREPAPGSLIASAPTHSPLHSFGRYLLALRLVAVVRRCSARTGWSARRRRGRPSPRRARFPPSRRRARDSPGPMPPYSPGTVMPSRPISPSFCHRSDGNALSWSIARARGAISLSAKRADGFAQEVDVFAERKGAHGQSSRIRDRDRRSSGWSALYADGQRRWIPIPDTPCFMSIYCPRMRPWKRGA